VHYDPHDVFVMQTEASKHWRVYDSPILLPGKNQPFSAEAVKPNSVIEELDLCSGDLIYIPRGYLHNAGSQEQTSLHLTIGVNTITWGAVAMRALECFIENEPELRESLPPGFALSQNIRKEVETRVAVLLDRVARRIDVSTVIDAAAQSVLFAGRQVPAGHLLDVEKLPRLLATTSVKRREGIVCRLVATPEVASLSFFGKVIEFPGYVEPQLQFVTAAESSFTTAEMPDGLDKPGRLVLLETLIREGLLTIC
jgi:ribosomal protein L16 Arg81 hydroxylase